MGIMVYSLLWVMQVFFINRREQGSWPVRLLGQYVLLQDLGILSTFLPLKLRLFEACRLVAEPVTTCFSGRFQRFVFLPSAFIRRQGFSA